MSGGDEAIEWLRRGHVLEAEGTAASLAEAIRAYDTVIALLRALPLSGQDPVRRNLGGAWMNRGNALQKVATPDALVAALEAYDQAIALLRELPIGVNAPYRNSLGSAWMNRGHALLQQNIPASLTAAIESLTNATEVLRELPIDDVPAYRLNLAGAQTNLANALLLLPNPTGAEAAQATAKAALTLVAAHEDGDAEFAQIGLMARRAVCDALGQLLFARRADKKAVASLVAEASDVVDAGLALARQWETRGATPFRPLAERLFRFGARLYQRHQPQFLAEFILENLDSESAPPPWTRDPGLLEIGAKTVTEARDRLALQPILNIEPAALAKLRETSRSLTNAAERVAALQAKISVPPPILPERPDADFPS